MPSLSRAISLHQRVQAQLLSARCALAAERFRLAHGRFPNALTELVPGFLSAVPNDPFARGPLRYAVTQELAVIYSVGADGIDSGGSLEKTGARNHDPLDVGTRLRPVELRKIVLLEKDPNEER
jgi:hypothetical protein